VAKILYRGMGSQAFIGTARSGLFIEEHPDDWTQSLLVHYKSNTGAKGVTQRFSKAGGHFEWCGMTRIGHDLLAGDGGPGPLPVQRLKACLWLEEQLTRDRVCAASEIYKVAEEQHDWSKKVVRSASEYLKVTKRQIQGDFLWSLPPLKFPPKTPPLTGTSGGSWTSGGSGGSGVDCILQGEMPLKQDILSYSGESPQDIQDAKDAQDTPDPPVLSAALASAAILSPLRSQENGASPPVPPCPHPETELTTYPDGSVLCRCTTCHQILTVTPRNERNP
jgi:hypothetical protein